MTNSSHAHDTEDASWVAEVRQVVDTWLRGCDIAYPVSTADVARDDEFYRMCNDVVAREGYPVDEGMSPYLATGINIATTGYIHLPDIRARVYIALYTAYLAAVDDIFAENVAPVKVLFQRMLLGQKQECPLLDAVASILGKTPLAELFGSPQDAMILTSTFNFITSMSVDDIMRGVELPPCAEPYTRWISLFSGANEAYAIFAFPPEIPFCRRSRT